MPVTLPESRCPSAPSSAIARLVDDFRAGRIAALARAISVLEDGRTGHDRVARELLRSPPKARRVGFTGPPGAGKSSLVAAATDAYREAGEQVGIVAVDPTSPYSGGALLGDRIRMNDLATDPGIFIRSMATRGSLGGLSGATRETLDLMDAFGFDRLLVETVGVGQTELEVVGAADTVVVTLVPESGDSVQAMKAGLTEIADVFVVNKADRPGADRLARDLRQAIRLREEVVAKARAGHHGVDLSSLARPPSSKRPRRSRAASRDRWTVPVLTTIAHRGEGLDGLLNTIGKHRAWLRKSGELARRRERRAEARVRDAARKELLRALSSSTWADELIRSSASKIAGGETTPYEVAAEIRYGLLRR